MPYWCCWFKHHLTPPTVNFLKWITIGIVSSHMYDSCPWGLATFSQDNPALIWGSQQHQVFMRPFSNRKYLTINTPELTLSLTSTPKPWKNNSTGIKKIKKKKTHRREKLPGDNQLTHVNMLVFNVNSVNSLTIFN